MNEELEDLAVSVRYDPVDGPKSSQAPLNFLPVEYDFSIHQ